MIDYLQNKTHVLYISIGLFIGTLGVTSLYGAEQKVTGKREHLSTNFEHLTKQCKESIKYCDEKEPYGLFSAVISCAREIKKHNLSGGKEHEVIARYLSPFLGTTRGKSARALQSKNKETETLRLLDQIQFEYGDIFVQPARAIDTAERIGAKTALEFFTEYRRSELLKQLAPDQNKVKNFEISLPHSLAQTGKNLTPARINKRRSLIFLALVRVLGHWGIDEILAPQIRTTEQKALELVLPIMLAVITQKLLAGKGITQALSAAGFKALLRLILVRLYLDKTNKFYQVVNIAALTLPFALARSVGKAQKKKGAFKNPQTWGAIGYEGGISLIIYELLPFLTDKMLKQNDLIELNPEQRKKAIKNSIRDIVKEVVIGS